jgi:hypothetical protein
MRTTVSAGILAGMTALILAWAQPASAQDTAASGPLAAFGALIVGTWEADGSRHEFTWGVGHQVLRSRSWFAEGDAWTLVSEGWWYWDPAEQTIRGQTVAVNMGIDLFEHRSRVEGSVIVSDLVSHGELGGVYVERWAFGDDGYSWALEQDGAHVMGARYVRGR